MFNDSFEFDIIIRFSELSPNSPFFSHFTFQGSRLHGSSSSSVTLSTSIRSTRQTTAPSVEGVVSSQVKDMHMGNPTHVPSKHRQLQLSTYPLMKPALPPQPQHSQGNAYKISPPLPRTLSSQSSHTFVLSQKTQDNKHKSYKDHHGTLLTNLIEKSERQDKHSLLDPATSSVKVKKSKTDESQLQHKQHLSLKDYRQSKRQNLAKGGGSVSKKTTDSNTRPLFHSLKSKSTLVSVPNSLSAFSQSRVSSSTSLPPLPSQLPLNEANSSPPPPPPPNN